MSKVVKLSVVDMKALLPPVPVPATESLEQFEKVFDQLVASLKCQDMVELIHIRDFAVAAWEEARYTRHRVVAFDRKFKDVVAGEVPDYRDPNVRQKAVAKRLAEYLPYRPRDVGHLIELEDKVTEAADDVSALLKRTPAELAYNKALERNINFHKDLEVLITSIRKRRNEALRMLDCYRQSLGKHAEQIMAEILDAEFNLVPNQAGENQLPQVASSPPPVPAQAEHHAVADHCATVEDMALKRPQPVTAMTKMARTRSGGPRTIAGKTRSSLNALRHGLAARHRRQTAPPDAVDRLAQAICGGKDDAEVLAAARAIAENEFVRSAIQQQKIIAIERLKDATAIALRKGDNSFTLAKARFMEAWLADREIQSLIPQVRAKYRDQISPPLVDDFEIVPIDIKMLLEEPTEQEEEQALELAREEIKRRQRNDYEALEEAIPDLIRLERYDRRAWSRQKRAIQEFVLMKFSRAMAAARQVPTS